MAEREAYTLCRVVKLCTEHAPTGNTVLTDLSMPQSTLFWQRLGLRHQSRNYQWFWLILQSQEVWASIWLVYILLQSWNHTDQQNMLASNALLRWTGEWRTALLSATLKTHREYEGAEHEDLRSPGNGAWRSRAARAGTAAWSGFRCGSRTAW